MHRFKTLISMLFASAAFALLLLFPAQASSGAVRGLDVCARVIIPSLFPFFVLSSILTGALSGMSIPLLRPIGLLFRIPKGAEYLLISALLGGYPVGAQAVAAAYQRGELDQSQAERMLSCCNNPGPSFLFGMVSFLFSDKHSVWLLWGITILSAIMVAKVFYTEASEAKMTALSNQTSIKSMEIAVKAMGCVCGWIIVFRVLISFFSRWFLWRVPIGVQAVLIGFLELSNACYELSHLSSMESRFLICGCILSFGGLCVTMQTSSVIGNLSMKHYCTGKILQTLFSFILCISILRKFWVIPIAALGFACIPWKYKKRSRFPRKAIV